jgi:hypothetical protein
VRHVSTRAKNFSFSAECVNLKVSGGQAERGGGGRRPQGKSAVGNSTWNNKTGSTGDWAALHLLGSLAPPGQPRLPIVKPHHVLGMNHAIKHSQEGDARPVHIDSTMLVPPGCRFGCAASIASSTPILVPHPPCLPAMQAVAVPVAMWPRAPSHVRGKVPGL